MLCFVGSVVNSRGRHGKVRMPFAVQSLNAACCNLAPMFMFCLSTPAGTLPDKWGQQEAFPKLSKLDVEHNALTGECVHGRCWSAVMVQSMHVLAVASTAAAAAALRCVALRCVAAAAAAAGDFHRSNTLLIGPRLGAYFTLVAAVCFKF